LASPKTGRTAVSNIAKTNPNHFLFIPTSSKLCYNRLYTIPPHKNKDEKKNMFFDPLWFYLKQLAVTLVVEVVLLYVINKSKGLDLVIAGFINIVTHISLHIFFSLIITVIPYGTLVYISGEIAVWLTEAGLYRLSQITPNFKKSLFIALVLNLASIIVGYATNLLIF
jgi:hypothetical protein